MGTHKCGNCGSELPRRLRHARMINCDHCDTTSVLRDKVFELAGSGGIMADAPSLIHLGQHIEVKGINLLPVGHARFSYGRGWWDEFWCLTDSGEGRWLSADEGDYALELPLVKSEQPKKFRPALGTKVKIKGYSYLVTEAETATCLAVRGELPEALDVGEAHLYFDLSGRGGRMATFEKWDGGEGWTVGFWIDAWDTRVP